MDQTDLDVDNFRQALDQLPDLKHLELQGEGEPLLHKNFFAMAKLATDRGIKVSTISNGSLFTSSRIKQIIDCGIQSVMVSIESRDESEFQQIRGGSLKKVKRGITDLINYRNDHHQGSGPALPAVGFTVTVLKSTQQELTRIADLYQELNMDGGILIHTLSPMNAYSQHYSDSLKHELLSPMAQGLVWTRYKNLMAKRQLKESPVNHFWDDLLSI